jgi:hypothetical protein
MLDGPGKNAGDAGKETVRRKRFQHGCVREVKHGSRRVWIGKYYENGQSRTRVLGPVAQMGEGEAWAELQRKYLNPVNEGVGFRQTLPSNFREYVQRAFIPQRRENWKEDSTEKTTLERYKNYLFPAFERFELRDLTRDKLQQFLKERANVGAFQERGGPPEMGFECHLQDGRRGCASKGQPGGLVGDAERSEEAPEA